MSYDKMSLASFKEALKNGKYAAATGARRAVGKAHTLTDADKDKARAMIEAHFGEEASAASPKRTPVKKKVAAAKRTAAAPKKVAAKRTAAASADHTPRARAVVPAAQVSGFDIDNIGSISAQMRIAEKTIQNVGAALSVITQAKEKWPEANLGFAVEEMGGTLAGAVNIFRQIVHAAVSGPPEAEESKPAVRQGIVNNGVVPNRAEALFQESGPDGEQAQATD